MTRPVGFDICCNDPDNGLFAGRVQGIQLYAPVGDAMFELEPRTTRAPTLTRLEADVIRIAGKRWKTVGSREWVGNWCWNRYFFTRDEAVNLLIWLHGRKLLQLTTGDSWLYHAWREGSSLERHRPRLLRLLAEAA